MDSIEALAIRAITFFQSMKRGLRDYQCPFDPASNWNWLAARPTLSQL